MVDMVFGRRYRVTEKIGTGGMADVYKAVDEVLGRTVAVKVLHPQYAADPNFVARFRQEAQAAANLSHPNIVNIYDWGQDDSIYYIVMEWVRGTDLKTLLMERGPLDPMKAAEYGIQVASALSVAHGYDIIHRDIKPHNIVLTPEGSVKVMDFGIARAGNTTMTQTGSVLGTAQYISPEQAQGRSLTPASDLYSLGIVLYELTTGRLPFEGDTPVAVALKQVNEEAVPPRKINPNIPASLEAVIMRAMRKNPAERYAAASEMRDDLRRVVSGAPVAAAPGLAATSVMPAVQREEHAAAYAPRRAAVAAKKRNPWPWIALAAALILLGLLGAWMTGLFGQKGVLVPDLKGKTPAEARTLLQERKLTLGAVTTQTDANVPKGQIVDQSPAANTPVSQGAVIAVVVSSGVPKVTVPDVTGIDEASATSQLEQAGFKVTVVPEYSTSVDEGQVIRTEPAAGEELAQGSEVRLVVSRGQQTVTVPSVVGSSLSSAKSELADAGLKVSTTQQYSDEPAGRVISQNPGQGIVVAAGTTVTLVVSKGQNLVTVPNVVGKSESDARSALESAGFKVTVDYQPVDDPTKADLVIDQSPSAKSKVAAGTEVSIVVGQAATP